MEILHGDYIKFKEFHILAYGYNHKEKVKGLPYYWKNQKQLPLSPKRFKPLERELKGYISLDPVYQSKYAFIPKNEVDEIIPCKDGMKKILLKGKLTKNEEKARDLAFLLLDNTNISEDSLGIAGSLLLGFENNNDIDFVVYGEKSSKEVISFLETYPEQIGFSKELLVKSMRFLDPKIPVNRERYPNKIIFRDKPIDMMYDFDKGPQDFDKVKYIDRSVMKLKIVDSSLRLMRPCVYEVMDSEENEWKLFSYPIYPYLLEGDVVLFKGRIFEYNGKNFAGCINPHEDSMRVLEIGS
ncbi:MAG: hypothetical protein JSV92_02105 [archaeon]|nr:MAG: hypothetical protein JSV92_02105 [archaeon]